MKMRLMSFWCMTMVLVLLPLMLPIGCLGVVVRTSAQSSGPSSGSSLSSAGWWKFDDGSGTTATDSSGNGHAATLASGISWGTGQSGDAVSANGSNGYVSIPAIDLSGTQAITWTVWVNRTYSSSGASVLLEDTANYNSSTTGFGFFPDGDLSTGCLGLEVSLRGDAGYTTSCYAQPSSGVWHHIAVVLDKSQAGARAISLYIDGQVQTATTQSHATTNANAFGNNPLYLFSRGGTAAYTSGKVDDLRLYAQALSATQIQQIYQEDLPAPSSLAVSPASASVAAGSTAKFTATGTYSDGSTQDLSASVLWSSSNTAAATISTSGLATSLAAGSTTINAVYGAVSGTATLAVTTPVLTSLTVTPASPTIQVGGSQQFTAIGSYNNGSTQDLTASVAWSTTDSTIATVSATGIATGIANGSTVIQATLGSISGQAVLKVSTFSLQSIAITPSTPQVAVASTLQLTATGTYTDGSTQDLTSQVVWSATDSTVASVISSGLVTGIGTGTTSVQASLNSISGAVILNVTPSGLVGWWPFNDGSGTTAADASGDGYNLTLYNGMSWGKGQTDGAVSANGVNQYLATPPIDLSSTQAFTMAAWINRTWSSSGPSMLSEISSNYNSVSNGFFLIADDATDCGIPSAIVAGLHGDKGYALNCYAAPTSSGWHHLVVLCDKSQTGNNEISLYIDDVLQTPVSRPYTVANSNTFGKQPLYFFSRAGSQYFTAGTVSDLRVYNRALSLAEITQIYELGFGATSATLQSLAVTPIDSAIVIGNTEQLSATGTYSDGSTHNLDNVATWTSSDTTVATISSGGLATGIAAGSTVIQAASGSITASANLGVVPNSSSPAKFVQSCAGDGGATIRETTYMPNAATTGNLILVFAHWDNQAATATVSDQLKNTYVPIFPPTNAGSSARFQVWYAKNVTGGAQLAVTITFSQTTASFSVINAIEYSGIDTTNPLDGTNSATGAGLYQNSGSITVPNANSEIVIGMFGYDGYALTYKAGYGYTIRSYEASTISEDQPAVVAGTYSATASSNKSANWAAFVMAFKYAVQ